ncbi:MAG TPA: glycosyltransferase family 39 protein [Holophagaceae bacterium]|jgi:4-amino-4-deoxy-L-arabinose transferase-like glycosyltransferase|nr:glycosyltransferase family 39 protein [Holophagaceae bacterium]
MTRRERLTYGFLWLVLGLLPLFLRPLWEPDEARYAEIPREMLASHDWLTPRLNGVLYFEKPPLQYWMSAVSLKLFGHQDWAARLPLALAAAIMLWCAWRLAKRLGSRGPIWAAVMAATTILGFIVGQILTLDALFSALTVLTFVAAVEAVATEMAGGNPRRWLLVEFAVLALAFLAKGLAALVLPGGALLFSLCFARSQPKLRRAILHTLFDPLGWILAVALTAPWFVMVDRANPGHATFFFVHEHLARFLTHEHARQGSNNPILDKLYFAGILLVGLLPWLSASVRGLKRGWTFVRAKGPESEDGSLHRWLVGATGLFFAWPFVFFSLSGSKLPPYILPVVVPLMALACAFERGGEEPATLRRAGIELALLGLAFLGYGLVAKQLPEGAGLWVILLGAAWIAFGAWCMKPLRMTVKLLLACLSACLLLLTLTAERAAGPPKEMASLVKAAPADAEWISYGVYRQGIAWYTGRRSVVLDGTGELAYGREHLDAADQERWLPEDRDGLLALASRLKAETGRPVMVVASPRDWESIPVTTRAAFTVIAQNGGNVLAEFR